MPLSMTARAAASSIVKGRRVRRGSVSGCSMNPRFHIVDIVAGILRPYTTTTTATIMVTSTSTSNATVAAAGHGQTRRQWRSGPSLVFLQQFPGSYHGTIEGRCRRNVRRTAGSRGRTTIRTITSSIGRQAMPGHGPQSSPEGNQIVTFVGVGHSSIASTATPPGNGGWI